MVAFFASLFFFLEKRARGWRLRGCLSLSPPKALARNVVSREKNGKVNGQKGPCLADAKMSYKSLRCKSSVLSKKAVYRSGREQQAKKSQREERGGRRIESVARCGGELGRKEKKIRSRMSVARFSGELGRGPLS